MLKWIGFIALLWTFASHAAEPMTQLKLESIIKSMTEQAEGGQGSVEFVLHGQRLWLLSDTKHDRMRIILPIVAYDELSQYQIDRIMQANFHSALDARYAVSDGVLYSAFIHPLASLTEQQVESAVVQVMNLGLTFGTEYSSGSLQYGGKIESTNELLEEPVI